MRHTHPLKTGTASLLLFVAAMLCCSTAFPQDTLHLNYHFTQIEPHDTTSKKIDKWIKSLNGQHVSIRVVAYYHKPEFRKFSQQRCDELFLVLNRKARAQLTIEEIGPKKGKDWQRTMVDIVYTVKGADVTGAPKTEPAKETAAKEPKEDKKPKTSGEKKEKPEVAAGTGKKGAEPRNTGEKRDGEKDERPVAQTDRGPLKPVGNSPDLDKFTKSTDEEFAAKTLVIGLPGEEGAEYEKAKKKGGPQLSEYTRFAQRFSEAARNTFNQRWKYSKVIFVPHSEAQKMVRDNDKVVVTYLKKENGALPVMNLNLKSAVYDNILKITMNGPAPDESDFIMLQHKLARLFNVRSEFDREQLGTILAARKLYIGRGQLEMSQEQVSQFYTNPFVIVDDAELENVIANGETGAVYLKADLVKGSMNLALVDAPTGLILARAPGAAKGKLNAKTLQDLVNEKFQLSEMTPLTVY